MAHRQLRPLERWSEAELLEVEGAAHPPHPHSHLLKAAGHAAKQGKATERGKDGGGPHSQHQWLPRDPGSTVGAAQERSGNAKKYPVLVGSWLEKQEWLQRQWYRAGGDVNGDQGSILGRWVGCEGPEREKLKE